MDWKHLLFIGLTAFISLSGCRRESTFGDDFDPRLFKEAVTSWDFTQSADYDYDDSHIEIGGGHAALKQVNTTHDSTDGFSEGTFSGTLLSGGKLTLDPTGANGAEISTAWVPQKTNLMAHWNFNGSWTDSVNAHHGTSSGASFLSSGKLGSQAADFSAVGDFVSIPDHAQLKPARITLSLWFKSSTPGNFKYLLGKLQDNGLGQSSYALYSNGAGALTFYVTTTNGLVFSPTTSSFWDNSWHHAVGTYDESKVRLYVDGKEIGSGTASTDPIVYSTDDLYIGSFNSGSFEYDGAVDEAALWSTSLAADEVALVYDRQKQKYAGSFISPVIDLGTSAAWSGFSPKSDLPFFKELTDSSIHEDASSYAAVNEHLTEDLIGLWHFNESTWSSGNPVIDSSGSGNDGARTGSANTSSVGFFGRSGQFSAVSDSVVIDRSDTLISTNDQPLTISAWVYPRSIRSGALDNRVISIHRGAGASSTLALGFAHSNKVGVYNYTDTSYFYSVADVPLNEWQHLVLTYDGSCFQLYINGKADGACEVKSLTKGGSYNARIGSYNSASSNFDGYIDEFAIWKKGLTAAEVLQLYRRGANRIKYQIRSCDDPLCDGETWKGPDNTSTRFFSELHDYTSIDGSGNGSGAVQAASLDIQYADFTGAGLNVSDNRYFQYKVMMEADDNTSCSASPCLPELSSFSLEPTGRYYGGSPTVSNKGSVSYSSIKDITLTSSGSCTPKYQLSPNGSDFYYWDGLMWTSATNTVNQASTAGDVQSHIGEFAAAAGPGQFFFKAFLPSDLTQSCLIDSVSLQYSQ